jgi:hypothetical protein
MDETSNTEWLRAVRKRLSECDAPDDFLLQTSLNEAWFSNALAWLLNPKGSHGLGVTFAESFVSLVGQRRVSGDGNGEYVRHSSSLKHGKEGPGIGASSFSFRNAASLREYYLSGGIGRAAARTGRFCDVVFLDLDSADSFFLAIENKLFTSDRERQLQEYREAIDDKYARAKVREFVYLTLQGDKPAQDTAGLEEKHWVRLSWAHDVRLMLQDLVKGEKTQAHPSIAGLLELLEWLKHVTDFDNVDLAERKRLKRWLLRAAAECLHEELVRLDKPGGGDWILAEPTRESERLCFSSRPAAFLNVQLTPGLTVTVQGRRYDGRAEFEKIVVPFGAHADQVINLLDIAARDIYHNFFNEPTLYIGAARRLRTSSTGKEIEHRPIFEFANEFRHSLKPMLLQSETVRREIGIQADAVAEAQ